MKPNKLVAEKGEQVRKGIGMIVRRCVRRGVMIRDRKSRKESGKKAITGCGLEVEKTRGTKCF